jgi:hypothetical protein
VKYLLYLNLALAAIGTTVSVVLGYVVFAMWYNRDVLPSVVRDLPSVEVVGLCAVLLAVVAGLASHALWRRKPWRWAAEAALALLLPVLFVVVRSHLGGT